MGSCARTMRHGRFAPGAAKPVALSVAWMGDGLSVEVEVPAGAELTYVDLVAAAAKHNEQTVRSAAVTPRAGGHWNTGAYGPNPLLLPLLRGAAAAETSATQPAGAAAPHVTEPTTHPSPAQPAYLLADLWMF